MLPESNVPLALDHTPHQVTCLAQAEHSMQQRRDDPALVAEAQLCCSSAAAALHLLLQSNHHHSGTSPSTRVDLSNTSSHPPSQAECWLLDSPTLLHLPHPDSGRADPQTDPVTGHIAIPALLSGQCHTHVLNAYSHGLQAASASTNSQAYFTKHNSTSFCFRQD